MRMLARGPGSATLWRGGLADGVPIACPGHGAAPGGPVPDGRGAGKRRAPSPTGGLPAVPPPRHGHGQRSAVLVHARTVLGRVADRRRLRACRHGGALAPHGLATALGLEEPPARARTTADRSRDPDADSADGPGEPPLGAVRIVGPRRAVSIAVCASTVRVYRRQARRRPPLAPVAHLPAPTRPRDLGVRFLHRADPHLPHALHLRRDQSRAAPD